MIAGPSLALLGQSIWPASVSIWPRDSALGGIVNCSSRSAAIHNLTVYGTEILYTPANATTADGTDTGTSFEFQLYNTVLGVDAQCSTHVKQTDTAPTWQGCFVESRDTRITAAFRFDLNAHTLTVNETWACGGKNDSEKGIFQAWATNNISILCAETVDTDLGQHYCANAAAMPLPVNVTRILPGSDDV